eukprot:jgi/Psemu1/53448/gm1.53448_g
MVLYGDDGRGRKKDGDCNRRVRCNGLSLKTAVLGTEGRGTVQGVALKGGATRNETWSGGLECAAQGAKHTIASGVNRTEDIQCYNNVGIGQPVQSGERERLELNGHTVPPKKWSNLTPEARKHIKQCIHFHPGNRPCLTTLWFNEWRTMTEEAIIEKNTKKQSKKKKRKLKQFANKEKREEEDRKERNIVHWLQLYEKRWNSPEDLEEYNNYPVPCGAWGHVK